MAETLIFTCTHGADEPERATLPFIGATIAAVSGHRSIVTCTINAVRLGVAGGVAGIQAEGHEPLEEHLARFLAAGGELWLCSACTVPRGITQADCIAGAQIVGAASIVELLVSGARAVSFG